MNLSLFVLNQISSMNSRSFNFRSGFLWIHSAKVIAHLALEDVLMIWTPGLSQDESDLHPLNRLAFSTSDKPCGINRRWCKHKSSDCVQDECTIILDNSMGVVNSRRMWMAVHWMGVWKLYQNRGETLQIQHKWPDIRGGKSRFEKQVNHRRITQRLGWNVHTRLLCVAIAESSLLARERTIDLWSLCSLFLNIQA
jgi:hypothetical protein